MGTLFSTLDVARSGLQAAQVQIDVAGHNIANVNTEGYTRQRAELVTRSPITYPFGQLGRGVEVGTVRRIRDSFIDAAYRTQNPNLGRTSTAAQFYGFIEDLFLEPSENGFGTRVNDFFDSLNDFANNVESLPARQSVISNVDSLSASLREMAQRLDALRTNANEQIKGLVPAVNSITSRLASLNDRVRSTEVSGVVANDLRDERDRLLDELSSYMNITVHERADGQVDVVVGNDVMVNGIFARQIVAVANPALDAERNDLVEIRYADNNALVQIENGKFFGAMEVRDSAIPTVDAKLDAIAATIIQQLNRIQSQGAGLQRLSGNITSTNPVTDSSIALASAGLRFAVTAGTFDVVVYDSAGVATTTTIAFDPATDSLDDLATALSAVPNFSASVVGGTTLQLGAGSGYTYSFANDSGALLTSLGINGLFTGYDARTIGVNKLLSDNPSYLSSTASLDVLETGDNSLALAMAAIRDALTMQGGTASISDFYESMVAQVGVDTQANERLYQVEKAFVEDFNRRRQEVSGVSLDEEVTFLLQYEKAFQASARVVTTVDTMLETLLGMVR